MFDKEIHDALKQVIIDLCEYNGKPTMTISKTDYEAFCKEYVFAKLKGETFGRAFCKRFNINDNAISNLVGESFTKDLIETLGYIK